MLAMEGKRINVENELTLRLGLAELVHEVVSMPCTKLAIVAAHPVINRGHKLHETGCDS